VRSARDIVVFDLGGVLIDWNPRHLYRKLFDDEREMENFLSRVCTQEWNEAQDAGRPFAEGVRLLKERHPSDAHLIAAYHERWIEMVNGPIGGTVNLLQKLDRRGIELYALSNWSAETFALVRPSFSFLERFRDLVISGEEGVIKPDPAIFRILFRRGRFAPEQAVFIDDNPPNVAAAAGLGMRAIRFTDAAALERDLAQLRLL
jgi:2-haloacid dehalogenase